MKQVLILLALLAVLKAHGKVEQPHNKIHLRPLSKADVIAIKSAHLLELRFKFQASNEAIKPFLITEHERLVEELAQLITNK